MQKILFILCILSLLASCKHEPKKDVMPIKINSFKVVFTNQMDTLINLKNGMQLKIKKGTFDTTNSLITLKYTPILST